MTAAGEVLTPEEWAESSTEIALLSSDASLIESASPEVAAVMVTKALQESRSWLAVAMRGTDPTPIAQFRAWAATVEEGTRQRKLGREIELDAAEMVRRAERGIGAAVRRGQEAGQIAKRGDVGAAPAPGFASGGAPGVKRGEDLVRPQDAAQVGHASQLSDYYALAQMPDEDFEDALADAKAEGNMSRRALARKARGIESKPSERPEVLRGHRHHDPNRIVEQTVIGLEGFALAIELIDFERLDREQVSVWSRSLSASLQSLNRLSRQLKELDQT